MVLYETTVIVKSCRNRLPNKWSVRCGAANGSPHDDMAHAIIGALFPFTPLSCTNAQYTDDHHTNTDPESLLRLLFLQGLAAPEGLGNCVLPPIGAMPSLLAQQGLQRQALQLRSHCSARIIGLARHVAAPSPCRHLQTCKVGGLYPPLFVQLWSELQNFNL